ncbi:MAG: hypothetical protein QXY45_03890 [Candidatus Aenigmatarchaeota archaeon]
MKIDNLRGNVGIILVFIFSTGFFLYQHSTGLSWDFSAYVLNAKYIFSDGNYFEWLRPPIVPILLGIFSIFGWKTSEYLFIIFTSGLFLFSSIKLCKSLKIQKDIYYISSITFFTLTYSFSSGSELLSLSLLQLFISYLDRVESGIFLSLSSLTRYGNFIYFPMIILQKDWKKILISLILCFLVIFPWLIYNFLSTGNPLTSIIDFYLMNVKFRVDLREKIDFKNFLIVGNFLTPLFLFGIIKSLKSIDYNFSKISIFLILCLFSYFTGAFKYVRYLFPLIIPISYFSTIAYNKKIKYIYFGLFLIGFLFAIIYSEPLERPDIYMELSKKLEKCETRSNGWIFLNYFGFISGPIPWKHQINEMFEDGIRFVIFKKIKDPDFGDFWKNFNIIEETEEYLIVGKPSKCKPQNDFTKTYFETVSEACGIEIDIYSALFYKDKLCSSIRYCEDIKYYLCS